MEATFKIRAFIRIETQQCKKVQLLLESMEEKIKRGKILFSKKNVGKRTFQWCSNGKN